MIESKVTAAVLVGASLAEPGPQQWVRQAQRAAALDLSLYLSEHPLLDRVVLVSPEPFQQTVRGRFDHMASQPGPIHVGHTLAQVVETFDCQRLLYFGGGAAPLLGGELLTAVLQKLHHHTPFLILNNRYSTDWAGLAPARLLLDWAERLPRDNNLGWLLSHEAGLAFEALPPSAASRLDIDTPADLLLLRHHPDTGPHLSRYLATLPLPDKMLQQLLQILSQPARHILLAGRVGPDAWQALNEATYCWIRVLAEERGMVATGREARGEVFSLLAHHMEQMGLERFFALLAEQVDGALIDSRVLLAHHRLQLSAAERFASDMGLIEQINEPWLKRLTTAVQQAPIPILLGGHGLLAGDLFALCDLLKK